MTSHQNSGVKPSVPVDRRPSIAIIASHPIQHYVPVYQRLAQIKEIQVKVFFVAENGAFEYFDSQFNQHVKWDVPLTEGYEHAFLSPKRILDDYSFFNVDDPTLLTQALKFDPDFVWINGYGQRINWRALSLKANGAKIIYTSDSNLEDSRTAWKRWVKQIAVRYFFSRCDYFLSYGPKNSQYLENYGVREERIDRVTFPVDMPRWKEQRGRVTRDQIAKLRAEFKLPDTHRILLFVGKLIPHKRPQDIIALVDTLRDEDVSAIVVGSGEMEETLFKQVKQLGLASRVLFVGFLNQSKLAPYFSLADLFIFPSEKEPYGAIASEVLPFGLPVVASDNIGSVGSSMIDGENALLYSCGDIEGMAKQVLSLLGDEHRYKRFCDSSRRMSDAHDAGVIAQRIRDIMIA